MAFNDNSNGPDWSDVLDFFDPDSLGQNDQPPPASAPGDASATGIADWNEDPWHAADPSLMNSADPADAQNSQYPDFFENAVDAGNDQYPGFDLEEFLGREAAPESQDYTIDPALLAAPNTSAGPDPLQNADEEFINQLLAEAQPRPPPGQIMYNPRLDDQGDTDMMMKENDNSGYMQQFASPYRVSPPRPEVPASIQPPENDIDQQLAAALGQELGRSMEPVSSPLSSVSSDNIVVYGQQPIASETLSPAVNPSLAPGSPGPGSFVGVPDRARIACSSCRTARRKCDVKQRGIPCTFCRARGKVCDLSRYDPKPRPNLAPVVSTGRYRLLPPNAKCSACSTDWRECDVSVYGQPCSRCKTLKVECNIDDYFDKAGNLLKRANRGQGKGLAGRFSVGSIGLPRFLTRREAQPMAELPSLEQMLHPQAGQGHLGLGAFIDDGPRYDYETPRDAAARQELAQENMGISQHPMRELERLHEAVDSRDRRARNASYSAWNNAKIKTRKKMRDERLTVRGWITPGSENYDQEYAHQFEMHEQSRQEENALRREAARRWAIEYSHSVGISPPLNPPHYEVAADDDEVDDEGNWTMLRTRQAARLPGDVPVNIPNLLQRCETCAQIGRMICDVGSIGLPCTRCKELDVGTTCMLAKPLEMVTEGQVYSDGTPNPVGKIPTFAQRPDAMDRINRVAAERGGRQFPAPASSMATWDAVGQLGGEIEEPLNAVTPRDVGNDAANAVPSPANPLASNPAQPAGGSAGLGTVIARPLNITSNRGRQQRPATRPLQNYDRAAPSRLPAIRNPRVDATQSYWGLRPRKSIQPRPATRIQKEAWSRAGSEKTCWSCRALDRRCSGKTGGTTFWPWCKECFERGDAHNCMWGTELDFRDYQRPGSAQTDPAIPYRRRFVALQAFRKAQQDGTLLPRYFDDPPGEWGQISWADTHFLKKDWTRKWNRHQLHERTVPLPNFELGVLKGIPTEADYKSLPGVWEELTALASRQTLPATYARRVCNERGVWTEDDWYVMLAGPIENQTRQHGVSPAKACDCNPHTRGLPKFHTCDTCHADQMTSIWEEAEQIFKAAKMWFCQECAQTVKSMYADMPQHFKLKRCTCNKQAMISWLCNMDRYHAIDTVLQRTRLVDEWLRRSLNLTACGHSTSIVNPSDIACATQKPADAKSGVWRCKSCKDVVIDTRTNFLSVRKAAAMTPQQRADYHKASVDPQGPSQPRARVVTAADYLVDAAQEEAFFKRITSQRQILRDRGLLLRGG
ncbi:hypothetical protein PVAG01_08514 [Phlyctema vagabunda]|uniref:Zn(2)-C6 fungal-type domain-containing protein n=1 Tax=Phlyctema vagabunda TaxID=108571 RepID=A0ABR4P9Q8_9HELO